MFDKFNENKNNSEEFVNIGSYRAEEADIIKNEFEKQGIPTKMFYPGTNVGRELMADAIWTAYTLRIRYKDIDKAKEICERFDIKPVYKIPLPHILYRKNNGRCLLFFALLVFLVAMITGSLGILKVDDVFSLYGISGLLFILYYVYIGLSFIKKYLDKT